MDVSRAPSARWFRDDESGESWASAVMLETILSRKANRRILMTLLVEIPNGRMRAGVKVLSCFEDRELAQVLA